MFYSYKDKDEKSAITGLFIVGLYIFFVWPGDYLQEEVPESPDIVKIKSIKNTRPAERSARFISGTNLKIIFIMVGLISRN